MGGAEVPARVIPAGVMNLSVTAGSQRPIGL